MIKRRPQLRLLVTGGRTYDNPIAVKRVLVQYRQLAQEEGKALLVIQGGARGADNLAREWCKKNGVPCITVDAHWDYYDNAAGPIRNGWLLEFCDPTHCYVFPGDKGTRDMRDKAQNAGLHMDGHEGWDR